MDTTDLEHHLDCEHSGEDVIEVVEDVVSVRLLLDGVLRRQRYRTRTDHDHNEQIEVTQVDHKMTEPPDPA